MGFRVVVALGVVRQCTQHVIRLGCNACKPFLVGPYAHTAELLCNAPCAQTYVHACSKHALLTFWGALWSHKFLGSHESQVDDGPCVMYIGEGGAGNFVKMVHNGIEYGDMQVGGAPLYLVSSCLHTVTQSL